MTSPSHKLLICSADENSRESLKLMLEEDYEMILTDDAGQALDILAHAKDIGTVLLDTRAENFTETLAKVKEGNRKRRVVLLLDRKSRDTISPDILAGADGTAVRPFQKEDILKAAGER